VPSINACHPVRLLEQNRGTVGLFVPVNKKIEVKMVQNTVTIGIMLHSGGQSVETLCKGNEYVSSN
jgi:hypothetical protein